MALPYIQHDNIFVVPIIHHRLTFAVLVHQAAREVFNLDALQPNTDALTYRHDLVAVALPHMIRADVESVVRAYPRMLSNAIESADALLHVSQLPKVALIIARLSGDEHREVFPISPCDGAVEAVRLSHEFDIPLQFVDKPVEPGNLALRTCRYDPDWPDDSMALHVGAECYLRSIIYHIAQPPHRSEPLDTLREFHIADRLKRLQPRYRRILFICDAKLVEVIGALLESRGPRLSSEHPAVLTHDDTAWSTHVVKPSLDIILQYLDDFPRLVEVFEHKRHSACVHKFTKWDALLTVLYQGGRHTIDLRASTRKHRTAITLLTNVLANSGRGAPSPTNVYDVFSSCFSKEFAQRVLHHLAAYRPQVKLAALAPFDDHHTDKVVLVPRDEKGTFVTRFCIPFPPAFSAASRHAEEGGSYGRIFVWPPLKRFWNRMRRRAYEAACEQAFRTQVTRFQGSLEDGIDMRKTMRSYYAGARQIFVKVQRRLRRTANATGEPTVWILRPERDKRCSFETTIFGLERGPRYTVWKTYARSVVVRRDDQLVSHLHAADVFGQLAFCDSYTTLADIKSYYGESFSERIPEAVSIDKSPDMPWWESMLLVALAYAQHTVVCVAPNSLRLTNEIYAAARESGKSIARLSLSCFGREHIDIMSRLYTLHVPNAFSAVRQKPGDDMNDPKINDYITQNCGHVLNGLPGIVWE